LFVPGILGTTLVDPEYNDFSVWGSYQGSFFYKECYEDIDLPLIPSFQNRLRPGNILWRFPVIPGLFEIPVFEEFAQTVKASGYSLCKIEDAKVRQGLYCLLYDWRKDIIFAARALEQTVSRLRRDLGAEKIHLVGLSRGSSVVRYYLRYGGADVLSDTREEERPGAKNVDTFFAVGAPFGGSLRTYYEINWGFSPGGPIGRPIAPHHASACPAAYELLRFDSDLIVDSKAQPVMLDLSDISTWKTLKLGPFLPTSFEALYKRAKLHAPRLGRAAMVSAVEIFLEKNLHRARSAWENLCKPHPIDDQVRTVTYASQNRPTMTKLVLVSDGKGERLLSTERQLIRELPELISKVIAPGDEYVTFNEVKKQSSYQTVTTDPNEISEGSYILVVNSRNHRELIKTDQVLTNILLNLLQRKS
jgi:pimeloyl-ACP methyl ester carboxylesterase